MKSNPKNRLFNRFSILGASLPAILTVVLATSADATMLYWDVNGATASFNAVADGVWDGTNTFWNTDAAGGAGTLSALTTSADDLNLSSSITSGTITLTGTANSSSLTLGSGVNFISGTLALGGTGTLSGIFMSSILSGNTIGSAVTLNNGPITFQNTGSRLLNVTGNITGGQNLILNSTNTGSINLASVNNGGTITDNGNSTTAATLTTVGSNVTGVTLGTANGHQLNLSNLVVNSGGTTLTNNSVALKAIAVGSVTGTGNLLLNGSATFASAFGTITSVSNTGNVTFAMTGGIGTQSITSVNNTGTVINSNGGTGGFTLTTVGSSVTGITQNSATSATTVGTLNVASGGTTLTNNQSTKLLTVTSAVTGTGNLILANNGTAANGITLNGGINHIGTVTNSGTGTGTETIASTGSNVTGVTQNSATSQLTLTKAEAFTGNVTVNAGKLQINYTNNTGNNTAGILTLGGGTLSETGKAATFSSQTFTSTTLNAGASTLSAIRAADNLATSAMVINLGTITRNVGSTLAFANPSTVNLALSASNGFTTTNSNINGIIGGWAIVNTVNFASNSGTHIINATTSNNTWTSGTNNDITTAGTIDIADGANVNSVKINTLGARTITLAGTSIIESGGLLVGSGVASNVTTITGGTLKGASGADLIVFQSNLSGGLTINSTIADNGLATGLTKSQAGTLTLGGANTFTGNTIVNAGVVALTNNAALQNSAVNTAGVGTITLSGTNTPTLGGLIGSKNLASVITSGAGSVTSLTLNPGSAVTNTYSGVMANLGSGAMGLNLSGLGTQVLSGTNTYTGATTLTGGTLSVGSIGDGGVAGNLGNASSAATNLVFDGGTLQYTGATATSDRAFTINAGKTATIDSANNISFAGATGTATNGALTKTGAGTLTLTGTNTHTGLTTVTGGALSVTGSLASTSTLTVGASGTANFANASQNLGAVSNSNTATSALNFSNAGGTVVLASLTGSGNTRFGSNGTVTGGISTGTVTSVGALNANISGGTITAGGLLTGTVSSGTVGADSLSSTSVTGGTNTITGAAAITTLDGGSTTVGGIATIGTLTSGTASLNGATSSITTLNGGTVNLGSTTLTVGSGSTSGAITGASGALTVTGALALTGSNTYGGITSVSTGGDLRVNGTNSGSGAVNVDAGANLGGSGSVIGGINVSGVLAPGNSIESIGGGDLNFLTGSTYAYELQTDLFAGTPNVAGDLAYSSGTLSIAAGTILSLTDLGGSTALAGGSRLTLISSVGAWNLGLFSYDTGAGLTTLADDSTITLGANIWRFDYNDTLAGSNFTGDTTGATNFVTMTVIPEPNVAALLGGLGTLCLLRRRRA